ncbi:hypothetical protein G7046_g5776 [Stylonectria norvegica]|nr:hypothetical protein G7046_g5776 [Stylonectria norvegica]
MYSAGYGFGNNAAPSYNNAHQPGVQPGIQPTSQQVMYNQQQQQQHQQQQQFPGMAPAFVPGANPQMMPGGPAGMMQNTAMPHMAANGQSESHLLAAGVPIPRLVRRVPFLARDVHSDRDRDAPGLAGYQPQFTGAPYGQVVPSSIAPQNFAPNYMMGGGMQGFPMNQQGMPQQPHLMQRMQQQQPNPAAMSQASTPQRPPSAAQGTPNNAIPSQLNQFSTPQPPSQGQTPTHQNQPSTGMSAPQTPTFSSNPAGNVNGGSTVGTPISPGAASRDTRCFDLILEINQELLYESIQIQATQQEIKKDHAAEPVAGEKKPTEEETSLQQDYLHCMRRLQANLSYLAALADRKTDVKAPPCPAYLSAPPLNSAIKLKVQPVVPDGGEDTESREERIKGIQSLYLRLQAAFPNFDPKKEPAYRMPAPPGAPQGQRPGNPAGSQASPTAQRTPQMSHIAPPMSQPGMPS